MLQFGQFKAIVPQVRQNNFPKFLEDFARSVAPDVTNARQRRAVVGLDCRLRSGAGSTKLLCYGLLRRQWDRTRIVQGTALALLGRSQNNARGRAESAAANALIFAPQIS